MKALKLSLLLLAVLTAGCSPKVIEKVRTEYVYKDVHHRDTLVTRDSVYIREWLKGDTVFVEKFRDRYVYRDRWRDSISIREVHDTTQVAVEVERKLSPGQRAKIGAFWWLVLAVAGLGVWVFRKPLFGVIRKVLP